CQDFGASVYLSSQSIAAKLMIVQQFVYPDDFALSVRNNIKADRIVGLMTLAAAGLDKHDGFIKQFGISKVYVPDKLFSEFLIDRRDAKNRYDGVEMIEVGLPFREYPVFPEFKADWIIAAPTLFSFHAETDKHNFLRNVLKLMDSMPASDIIAYKPHNGNARDYFTPSLYYNLAKILTLCPFMEKLIEGALKKSPKALKKQFERVLTGLLHLRLLKRATPMSSLTKYADISLEAFLPGVKKGVIGGLSNTIWGSLFFGLPYYNCVDQGKLRGSESELLNKSSAALLDVNVEYFGVSYCGGELSQGSLSDKIIYSKTRHKSIVSAVKELLAA
ncbi:MAG: hypothetical protein PHX43_01545, partial [Alphaproteobacteria bacterium]|nr:hypothetical protein [Alphaproteobacteria bacterium]